MILRLGQQQIIIHRLDLGGSSVLAGQAVTAGKDFGTVLIIDVSGADVLIQGLTDGADLLHTVQDSHLFHGLRHSRQQVLGREGTEQVYLQEAHLLAPVIQVLHRLLNAAGNRAHGHDDPLRVGSTVIIKEVILPARQLADFGHIVLNDVGELVIVAVVGLAKLEINVGVIHQGTHPGILGIQRIGAEPGQCVIVHQLGQVAVLQGLHLLNLMAGAEAVEEMQERDAGLDSGQMCHTGQVHDLLHAAGVEHSKAGLAAVHHIRVIAENRKCVGTHRTGSHMQYAGQTLTGDTMHGGDHQHQALRGGEAGGQCAGLQCTVASAAGAGLRLHLHQADRLIKDVLSSLCGPLIRVLRHGRRRGDGVNRRYLGKGIRHICRGFVTIADLHDLTHYTSSLLRFFACGLDQPMLLICFATIQFTF